MQDLGVENKKYLKHNSLYIKVPETHCTTKESNLFDAYRFSVNELNMYINRKKRANEKNIFCLRVSHHFFR